MLTRRGCTNYFFAMCALVGVSLLVGAAILHSTLQRHDNIVPATGGVQVTDSVQMPTWAPYGSYSEPPRTPATAAPTVPPDPGHGPVPVCWLRPTSGPCPPKP